MPTSLPSSRVTQVERRHQAALESVPSNKSIPMEVTHPDDGASGTVPVQYHARVYVMCEHTGSGMQVEAS